MAGKASFNKLEPKPRYRACLDWGLVELEPRRRFSALMLRIEALTQGLKGLTLRWKEGFIQELHLEAFTRPESLSEVVKLTSSKMQREVRMGTGGACPPGAAHQHHKRRAGQRRGRSPRAGVPPHPRGAS